MIAMTTSVMIAEMIDATTNVAKTTTATTTTIEKSGLHHHHLKGATPTVRSSQPTERSISSSVVAKRLKATYITDQTPGKLRNLCVGLSSQLLSPGKIIGSTSLTPDLPASR
jgi:hypothetical protein